MQHRGLSADEVSDVYQRYGALLSRRCLLLLRDKAQAEDAVQELLPVLLQRGEGLRVADSKWRWLARAADRACIDLLRRGKHLRAAVDIDDLDPVGVAPGTDPEARCAAVESLQRLDDDQQTLAIMLYVDGLSQGEAAAELGLSRVTINKRAQELAERVQPDPAPASTRTDTARTEKEARP